MVLGGHLAHTYQLPMPCKDGAASKFGQIALFAGSDLRIGAGKRLDLTEEGNRYTIQVLVHREVGKTTNCRREGLWRRYNQFFRLSRRTNS